ncbi:hypothetical protein, partial [Streptomyces sp. NPDC005877]
PEPPAAAVAQDPHWTATRERLRRRHRPIATLTICDDHEARTGLDRAKRALQMVQAQAEADPDDQDLKRDLATAQTAVDQAQRTYDEAAIVLRFQAVDRSVFDALKKAHPPTEEQATDGEIVNAESLGPDLIAACSLDGITAEEAREYLDTWANGEATALFMTCWNVQGETRMDLGKG